MCVCVCAYMCTCLGRGMHPLMQYPKSPGVMGPSELELQAIMSHLMWVLRTKLGFPERAGNAITPASRKLISFENLWTWRGHNESRFFSDIGIEIMPLNPWDAARRTALS